MKTPFDDLRSEECATRFAEPIAGNPHIDAEIRQLLDRFPKTSQRRMLRKILQDRDALAKIGGERADQNARHTFREFLVAARLNENGFRLEYSRRCGNQTPDWYDEDNGLLLEVFTCERGGTGSVIPRAAERIGEKVRKYRVVAADRELFLVVAVYGDFLSGFDDPDDCREAIKEGDLFNTYKELSGVIFFTETCVVRRKGGSKKQGYGFAYFPNNAAIRKIDLTGKLKDESSAGGLGDGGCAGGSS